MFFFLVENVALNKQAYQISSVPAYDAGKAVDGNLHYTSSVSETEVEVNPWWAVDLMDSVTIVRVDVFNKGEGERA